MDEYWTDEGPSAQDFDAEYAGYMSEEELNELQEW